MIQVLVFLLSSIVSLSQNLELLGNIVTVEDALTQQKAFPSRSLGDQRMSGNCPLKGEVHCSLQEGCLLGMHENLSLHLDLPNYFRSHLYQNHLPGKWNYQSGGLALQLLRSPSHPFSLALRFQSFLSDHENAFQDEIRALGFQVYLSAHHSWNPSWSSRFFTKFSRFSLKAASKKEEDFFEQESFSSVFGHSLQTFSDFMRDFHPQFSFSFDQEWKLFSRALLSALWPSQLKVSLLFSSSWSFSKLDLPHLYSYEQKLLSFRNGLVLNQESLSDGLGHWSSLCSFGLEERIFSNLERGPQIVEGHALIVPWMNLGVNYRFF